MRLVDADLLIDDIREAMPNPDNYGDDCDKIAARVVRRTSEIIINFIDRAATITEDKE